MNNWNKCYITYKDKKYDLGKIEEMFNLNVLNTNVFDVKLKDINNLKNITFMFNDYSSLISLPDISY